MKVRRVEPTACRPELARSPSLMKALPTIVLPLIFLALAPTFRTGPADYPFWLRGLPSPSGGDVSPLNTKIEAFKGVLRTEHQGLDRMTGMSLVGLIGVGLWRRRWFLHRSMFLPLAATLGAALAMPASIGTTAVVDVRMPVVVVLLAIASSDWPDWRRRWFVPLACALACSFVVRMGVVTEDGWRRIATIVNSSRRSINSRKEPGCCRRLNLLRTTPTRHVLRGSPRRDHWSTCPVGASSVDPLLCPICSQPQDNSRCN